MNSYLVKLVYQIVCGSGLHTAQFDEQLRYLTAEDEEAALEKGRGIGYQEEDVFVNEKQQLVRWKFIAVTELYSCSELEDGAEVFSQIRETGDAEGYRSFVRHKAEKLFRSIQTA